MEEGEPSGGATALAPAALAPTTAGGRRGKKRAGSDTEPPPPLSGLDAWAAEKVEADVASPPPSHSTAPAVTPISEGGEGGGGSADQAQPPQGQAQAEYGKKRRKCFRHAT
jgi:hypothetical protein